MFASSSPFSLLVIDGQQGDSFGAGRLYGDLIKSFYQIKILNIKILKTRATALEQGGFMVRLEPAIASSPQKLLSPRILRSLTLTLTLKLIFV